MTPSDHQPAGSPTGWGAVPWPPGWRVRHIAETGSTNADLLALGADAAPHRSVLATDHQTAGRGRLDRRWDAPPGANLLVSLLFRDVPADAGELVRRMGLAAIDAVAAVTGQTVRLKWPNDLLLDGRKVAGILAQRDDDGAVVVGMGMNVGWAPDGAARLGDGVDRPRLLAALLSAYDAVPSDVEAVHARYREALDTLGRRVRVELAAGVLVGTAVDLEPDGRLVVLDECAVSHRVDAGDVVHLRPA